MKTLIIDKDGRGQYMYQIVADGVVHVANQYGTFDLAATIDQAKSRFSFDEIVNLVK